VCKEPPPPPPVGSSHAEAPCRRPRHARRKQCSNSTPVRLRSAGAPLPRYAAMSRRQRVMSRAVPGTLLTRGAAAHPAVCHMRGSARASIRCRHARRGSGVMLHAGCRAVMRGARVT